MANFGHLVEKIKHYLGENGIDDAAVDKEELIMILKGFDSKMPEWKEYMRPDFSRSYTRNLVDDCNSCANLYMLCWTPGQSSLIHDHSGAQYISFLQPI